MCSCVGKNDRYSNEHSKSSYDVTAYFKNNKFCASQDINKLKNLKLELKLHYLARSIFVNCDDC